MQPVMFFHVVSWVCLEELRPDCEEQDGNDPDG